MRNIAIVIPPERVDEAQLSSCVTAWEKAFKVSVISVQKADLISTDGTKLRSIAAQGRITPLRFDAIAIMGGSGTRESLWDHPPLIKSLQKFDAARKLVAGIGTASMVLAQAGLLVGKQATTLHTPEMIKALKSYGAIYHPTDSVAVTWIVTGSGHDVELFATTITDLLLGDL